MSRELLSLPGLSPWTVDDQVRRLEHQVDQLQQQVRQLATAVGEIAGALAAHEARCKEPDLPSSVL